MQALKQCAAEIEANSAIRVALEQWRKFLSVAYGRFDDSPEMFLVHTYLSAFSKFIAYAVITKAHVVSDGTARAILNGSVFEKLNVERFAEDDFFHWRALPIPRVERGACVKLDIWAHDDNRINKGQTPMETTRKKPRHGLASHPRADQVPMRFSHGSRAQFRDGLTNAIYELETPAQHSWRRQRGFEQLAKAVSRRMLKEGDAPAANDRSRAPRIRASDSNQLASRGGTSLHGFGRRPIRTQWNAEDM